MLQFEEFDASEMSLSNYIMGLARDDRRFVGIPVFPYRAFRHAMIWVNASSGIREPRDLSGKRVGIPEYATTALLFVRGMLQHEYGVTPQEISWFRGRKERVALDLPSSVVLHDVGSDQALEVMLQEGKLDAVAMFKPPRVDGIAKVTRLFSDVRQVEADYFCRTGIFPIMHLIVIKRKIYEEHPWVAMSLVRAFQAAKEHCFQSARQYSVLYSITPWMRLEMEESEKIIGKDPYPYGVPANVPTLQAATEFSYEQRLSKRQVEIDQLFARETIDEGATD
jgi:4,5-dihydroxyphthalate decarboxylase